MTKGSLKTGFLSIVKGIDLYISFAIGVFVYYITPENLNIVQLKDVFGIGITSISIILPIFFTVMLMLVSNLDTSFSVAFDDVAGGTGSIKTSVYITSAIFLFALIFSITVYSLSCILPNISAKLIFSLFSFLLSYALGAAINASVVFIRIFTMQDDFLKKVYLQKLEDKNSAENNDGNQ